MVFKEDPRIDIINQNKSMTVFLLSTGFCDPQYMNVVIIKIKNKNKDKK